MKTLRHTVLAIAIAASSFGACAQTNAEHTQHHPAEPTPKASKASAVKPPSMAKESMAAMDSQMKTMRDMHEKMMAASTPDERKALMADHMKTMQDGMAMMGKMDAMGGMSGMGDMKGMGGMGGMGSGAKKGGMSMDMMGHHEMMEKRMEMMTTMMQMMMDRLPAAAPQ